MTVRRRAEVGDEVLHEDYGRGMVVEVRPRPFFDILEVAFADGVRRLNSSHPKILELAAPAAGTIPDTKGARARAVRSQASANHAAAKMAASAAVARAGSRVGPGQDEAMEREPNRLRPPRWRR